MTTTPLSQKRRSVYRHDNPQAFLFPEQERECLLPLPLPFPGRRATNDHDNHDHPLPFVRRGTRCLTLVTTTRFPFPEEKAVCMDLTTNPSLSQKRKPPIPFFLKRKWISDHGHPHPFLPRGVMLASEKEVV